jgi:large subunit ribosomal protein L35
MAYKFKPKKAVAKRFKVTKTGKLKRGHSLTSHLMSARPANKRRKLRRPAILFEGHARNMRQMMGISHLNPARDAHERALAKKAQGNADATDRAPSKEANPIKRASSRNTRSTK